MTGDHVDPDDLAAAIADGRPIDWAALAEQASTSEDRARLDRFALVAHVAGVHAVHAEPAAPRRLSDLVPGDHWGTLRVVERLGAGTSGTVYRAHDPALARDVALKILDLPDTADRAALDAVREGRLLARVRHVNVVSVFGADLRDGRVGVWMELVEGGTLESELQRRGRLPDAEVLTIAEALASALMAVHAAGVLHRDLKTDNVMRDARDGRIVLTDFSAGRDRTYAGIDGAPWPATLAGSPVYLAPELFDGHPASEQSDLYALGVCLHRLATGRFPVEAASIADLAEAHRARRGLETVPATSAPFDVVLSRLLASEPARRPVSAAALRRDLASCHQPVQPHARRRAPALAGGAMAVVIAVAGVGLTGLGRTPSAMADLGRPATPQTAAATLPITTVSDEARSLYARAQQRLIEVWDWHIEDKQAALNAVDRQVDAALAIDPSFASAWLLRARSLEARQGPSGAAREAAERALVLSGGVTTLAERAAIEGYVHRVRADLEPHRLEELRAAAQAYELLLEQVPWDYWALVELERLYMRQQQPASANRLAISGAEAHPRSVRLAAAAANAYVRSRNRQALRLVATRALATAGPEEFRVPRNELALRHLALWEARDAWMDGDVGRVLDVLRRLSLVYRSTAGQSIVAFEIASAYESLGRFDDARAAAATIRDRRMFFKQAMADARQERWEPLATRLKPGGVAPDDVLQRCSFMYIWAGWFDEAERLLAMYKSGAAPSTWQLRQEFEATLLTAQQRPEEALALFAPILADEEYPRLRMHEFVARARLQAGDTGGALTVLERIHRDPANAVSHGLSAYDWLRCVTLLAETLRDTGRLDDASRVADTVRRHLAVADADNPFADRLSRLP